MNSFADLKNTNITGRVRVCIELAKKQKFKNKNILDIGCSNGVLASLLINEKPRKYVGIDSNQEAINFAKKNVKKAEFFQGTADNIPLGNKTIDVTLMLDVIEHVPKNTELKVLKEVARVLRKDGKLILSTPNSNFWTNLLDPAWYLGHRHYNPEGLKKIIKKAGFKIELQTIRGGLWFSSYLILLYISKWLLGKPDLRIAFIEKNDDLQFSKAGIHTLYFVAKKK